MFAYFLLKLILCGWILPAINFRIGVGISRMPMFDVPFVLTFRDKQNVLFNFLLQSNWIQELNWCQSTKKVSHKQQKPRECQHQLQPLHDRSATRRVNASFGFQSKEKKTSQDDVWFVRYLHWIHHHHHRDRHHQWSNKVLYSGVYGVKKVEPLTEMDEVTN